MREQSKLAKGRFLGDPSNEFEHVEIKKSTEGEEAVEEEETVSTVKYQCFKQLYVSYHVVWQIQQW